MYPLFDAGGFGGDVVDIAVVAKSYDSESHKGSHIQSENGDKKRLETFQVTLEEDRHKYYLWAKESKISY